MRVPIATATVCLALAGTAVAAGGPAIPSGSFNDGPVGPGAKPGTVFRYVAVGGNPSIVERISVGDGSLNRTRALQGVWSPPAVTLRGEAGGLSADGTTLVLIRPRYSLRARRTKLIVLDAETLRTREHVTLSGAVSFDAISPDGRSLYLVRYKDPRDVLDYVIRRYDVAAGRYRGGPIVDPTEPDEKMTGQPISRKMSPDGRWAYTLYGGGDETFIHALDTRAGVARCIDLEDMGAPNRVFSLRLDVNPSTGGITVSRKGAPEATVDPQSFEVTPVAATDETGGDAGAGSGAGWLAPAAIACGIALLAAAATLYTRRHRRAAT